MNVSVDKDLCIGCGMCESSCSDVFVMQDNIAVVKEAAVPESMQECVQQTAKDCPVEAIKING